MSSSARRAEEREARADAPLIRIRVLHTPARDLLPGEALFAVQQRFALSSNNALRPA